MKKPFVYATARSGDRGPDYWAVVVGDVEFVGFARAYESAAKELAAQLGDAIEKHVQARLAARAQP